MTPPRIVRSDVFGGWVESPVPWEHGTPVVIVDAETWERVMEALRDAIDAIGHERHCRECGEMSCESCQCGTPEKEARIDALLASLEGR